MAYSIIVWLVNPGDQAYEAEEIARSTVGHDQTPGAATGVNIAPAFTRMVYGVYESQDEAEQALGDIATTLQQNAPLRVTSQGNRVFLVPADRVHYVVCDEVERPRD
jgi:hypothetical protein